MTQFLQRDSPIPLFFAYYIKHKNDPDFDLATFSKSIGHSSIRTTMEIYAHLDMTQNRFVQRSIDDLKDF